LELKIDINSAATIPRQGYGNFKTLDLENKRCRFCSLFSIFAKPMKK
jgi:hypothetical protein